jgi:NADH pyrophosphatase NudC (nudix superfamily)
MKTDKLFDIITSAFQFGHDLPEQINPPYCSICGKPEHHKGSGLIKVCPSCQVELEYKMECELARKFCKN